MMNHHLPDRTIIIDFNFYSFFAHFFRGAEGETDWNSNFIETSRIYAVFQFEFDINRTWFYRFNCFFLAFTNCV